MPITEKPLTHKERLSLMLHSSKCMLAYWENKPDDFWLTWKGHPKNEVLQSWKTEVNRLQSLYDKYEKKG